LVKILSKRLEETGNFVFGVLNPKQWKSSEAGIPIAMLRILKVRLMHASIRFLPYIIKLGYKGLGIACKSGRYGRNKSGI
jgi:hypothetical protein